MHKRLNRVLIAGASGMLGRALIETFNANGCTVSALSRSPRPIAGTVTTIEWDGKSVGDWAQELESCLAVVNLSGENIAQLWTPEARRRIIGSRVDATSALAKAIDQCKNPPKIWIQASATGIYGDTGEEMKEESDLPGRGFLAEVCQKWEAAAQSSKANVCILRVAPVFDRDEGAFARLSDLAKKFMGGAVGDGRQWMSWIHLHDLSRLFCFALEREWSGVYNACSPDPVRNKDLMSAIRGRVGRPWVPPIPPFALELAKGITKVEPDAILSSSRISAKKVTDAGFNFLFGSLDAALDDLLEK
jgi:uncharacterized protein (TIGR01777 family)